MPRTRQPAIVGQTPTMHALRARLTRFAQVPHPVLIRGETGSGKELAAQAIHDSSTRRGAFVAVNCATLRAELAAAELFGSRAGGFTGAVNREGLCVQARGGTLFLDEIGELPLDAQAMLLRVLALNQVRPVGGQRAVPVDFRLVCATHRDLGQMVRCGRFREDLLHRINTLTVRVPPLRERVGDIEALSTHFLDGHHSLTPGALAVLTAHAWPGNVRELRNVLIRASVQTDGPIDATHLDLPTANLPTANLPTANLSTANLSTANLSTANLSTANLPTAKDATRPPARISRPLAPLKVQMGRAVAQAVRVYGGNVREAARALQISPTTAYRYLGFNAPDP